MSLEWEAEAAEHSVEDEHLLPIQDCKVWTGEEGGHDRETHGKVG